MRTHLTSSLPQKRPMIAFPVALVMIVLCAVATVLAPQPGRHVNRAALPRPLDNATPVFTTDAPVAQVDMPAAR